RRSRIERITAERRASGRDSRAPAMQEKPGWLGRLFARFVALQVDRPLLVVLVAVLLTIPSFILARRLELRTGFESLLPENKASVKELERVSARTAGVA